MGVKDKRDNAVARSEWECMGGKKPNAVFFISHINEFALMHTPY